MYQVRVSDGVRIAVHEYGRKHRGHSVLLVHGWPLDHRMFEYQLQALLEQEYHIIAVDLRGFGASDRPEGGYTYDRMAMDLYEVIRFLELKKVDFLCFSMGAAIALRYMRLFRGYRVGKLLLIAAPAPQSSEEQENDITPMQTLWQLAQNDRPQMAEHFIHTQFWAKSQSKALENWFIQIALSASGLATRYCLRALMQEDGWEDMNSVQAPVFLFYGEEDVMVPPSRACLLHKKLKGAQLEFFKEAGHGVFYEQREVFNRRLLEVLEK